MHLLPESLVERLKTRQAVLVTGLGCAGLAGLPTWVGLCERMSEWIEDESDKKAFLALLHGKRLATATALLRDLVAPDALLEVLKDAYPVATPVPESVRGLVRAPWRGIVTTGFDALCAAALRDDDNDKSQRIVLAADAAKLEPGRGRFLLQLFGRADLPESLCLAPFETSSKVVATGASALLLDLHKKWSFVFVGFGPDDPDLAMLAGRLLGASPSSLEHYFVAPGLSAFDGRRVQAELGLVPVAPESTLEEAFSALEHACGLGGDKPPADNVEAWLERITAEPEDEEAHEMLEQGLAILCEHKEWERLVATLINKVELEPEAKEQAADLYEAGMVLDKELSAPDRAYPVLMMALHLAPHDAELLADTKRLAASAGQGKEFLEELREIEKEAADSPEGDQVALGVARMLAQDAAHLEEAIAAFQKLLDRAPGNREATAGLEALLRKTERWDALGALLTKAARRDPGNAEIAAKLEEIFERTQQNTPLVELLSDRLAHKPDDQPTLAKLETLHSKKQNWAKLAALHEGALERNPEDGEALRKLEDIYKQNQQWQKLGALYEKQLAKDGGNPELLDKLEDLYRKSEQWRELTSLIEGRASKASEDDARLMRIERAALFLDKLKDTDAALAVARSSCRGMSAAAEEIFAKCVERDADNPAALAGPGRAGTRPGRPPARRQVPARRRRAHAKSARARPSVRRGGRHSPRAARGRRQGHRVFRARAGGRSRADQRRGQAARAARKARGLGRGPSPCSTCCCARPRTGKPNASFTSARPAARASWASSTRWPPLSSPRPCSTAGRTRSRASLADLALRTRGLGRSARGIRTCQALTTGDSGTTALVSLCEQLALCALKTDDGGAAVRHYEEALALEPEQTRHPRCAHRAAHGARGMAGSRRPQAQAAAPGHHRRRPRGHPRRASATSTGQAERLDRRHGRLPTGARARARTSQRHVQDARLLHAEKQWPAGHRDPGEAGRPGKRAAGRAPSSTTPWRPSTATS